MTSQSSSNPQPLKPKPAQLTRTPPKRMAGRRPAATPYPLPGIMILCEGKTFTHIIGRDRNIVAIITSDFHPREAKHQLLGCICEGAEPLLVDATILQFHGNVSGMASRTDLPLQIRYRNVPVLGTRGPATELPVVPTLFTQRCHSKLSCMHKCMHVLNLANSQGHIDSRDHPRSPAITRDCPRSAARSSACAHPSSPELGSHGCSTAPRSPHRMRTSAVPARWALTG